MCAGNYYLTYAMKQQPMKWILDFKFKSIRIIALLDERPHAFLKVMD